MNDERLPEEAFDVFLVFRRPQQADAVAVLPTSGPGGSGAARCR
jgi:hypothetical protein